MTLFHGHPANACEARLPIASIPRRLARSVAAGGWPAALACAALLLQGCASSTNRAPVEDRRPPVRSSQAPVAPGQVSPGTPATAATADPSRPPLPGAENAGKPGYYSIKPGDTLIRIGLEAGQNWRDIAKWNNLENVNLIEVGQVLRVVPPGADPSGVTTRPVASAGRVESRPLDGTRPPEAAPGAVGPASGAASAAAPAAPAPTPAPAREGDDDITWAWPSGGPVASGFDEARSKGLAFTGKAGDPVLAAADGRVVYAGSGLRGYGNLVIVKHNATYLTAYAHNQTLLVKEDQVVRRGQKIAEMGSSDAERVQLHFEIRRQGKPVDPARLLPAR
jgi:lipoprotein NlpD